MFRSVGLRLAARLIPPILSSARPTFSRALFVSHFQTRSFLTTSPLAQAAAVTTTTTARTPSTKTKSSTTKEKHPVKKTPAKKTGGKKPAERVVVPRASIIPPQRPINGFIIFAQERNAEQPKAPNSTTMAQRYKEYGVQWRALPEHEREAYAERSALLRRKWAEDRLNWFKTVDPKVLKEINRRKKARGKLAMHRPKDPNAPKRVPSSFIFFLVDFRKANPNTGETVPMLAQRAGAAWRVMPDSQKEHYNKMSAEASAARRSLE